MSLYHLEKKFHNCALSTNKPYAIILTIIFITLGDQIKPSLCCSELQHLQYANGTRINIVAEHLSTIYFLPYNPVNQH